MKVCLYLELKEKLRGSGIGSALEHQKKALELNGVEYTTNFRENHDILHINSVGPSTLLRIRNAKHSGKKIVISAHTTHTDFKNSYRTSNMVAPVLKKYLQVLYNKADMVIAPSEYTRGLLRKSGVKAPIRIVSNGVDTEKLEGFRRLRRKYRAKYDLSSKDKAYFCVGNLFERKGFSTFVNVAKEFPDYIFAWFGPVHYRLIQKKLRHTIKNRPDNVLVTGYIEDIRGAFATGDVFFFPTNVENQGIVLLEAAYCSKPLIIRDIPVFKWLTHGVNCMKASSDEHFSSIIQGLDEKKERALGKEAKKMVRGHTLAEVGAELKEVYENLLR